ncbi:ubiquitin-conjugating enzyme/RWD-like protein [Mrakia frigida]|uniref:ubiquitin-conjugating enzyme E2 n=1 Tax=Mrakia frigida TaxID=29902 RepID=UPI003FCC0DAD
MASPAARKRLGKEFQGMQKSPPPFAFGCPDEKNILNWHFVLRGPPDSPYDGGEYYGVIMFPSDYPFKPPDIKMVTPSGRFRPGQKICTSMTAYHPASWNPAWSVSTILTGLLSFMLSDEITTGSITSTLAEKKAFALKSHAYNLTEKKFKEVLPEYAQPTMKDPPDMGVPPAPSTTSNAPPTVSSLPPPPPSPSPSSLQSSASSSTSTLFPLATNSAASSTDRTPSTSHPPTALLGLKAPAAAAAAATPNGAEGGGGGAREGRGTWRWVMVVVAAVVVGRLGSLMARG